MFIELEGEIEKHPGEHPQWEATTFEAYLMLTESGKYWLDFAIFAEYARQTDRSEPDSIEIGLLFQKQHLQTLHTLNLFWEKRVGPLAEPIGTFKYAWQSRYLLNRYFQPGFEIYGEIEDISKPGSFNQQQFRVGPMFAGSYSLGELFGAGKEVRGWLSVRSNLGDRTWHAAHTTGDRVRLLVLQDARYLC